MDIVTDDKKQKLIIAEKIAYELGDCPNIVEKVSADGDGVWYDVDAQNDMKLQGNKSIDCYRILNQNNERIAWGSMAVMTEKFNRLSSGEFLKYGDIVGVVRSAGLYYHYGVYKDDNCVIEYAGDEDQFGKNVKVRQSTFKQFLRKDSSNYFVLLFDETGGVPQKVFFNPVKWNENDLFQRKELKEYKKLYSPAETVERAESRLGEEGYDLLVNNCECFALWCKTGESKSYQSDKFDGVISGLMSIGSVGSVFASALESETPKTLIGQLVKEIL